MADFNQNTNTEFERFNSDGTRQKNKKEKKDEEPAQQGQRSFQPAEITSFIPYEKGRAHREFVPFLLKIILIYRNVCTVLKTIFTCKLDAADHFTK